ncbi:MAG: DEAD/DEAH box helicase [Chitinophagales bacterium]|nr:DEAD/DEAH box helicase [Chitinophagales bacterium]
MQKFIDLGLDAAIIDALAAKGFSEPTPIQEKVIPILLNRSKNVMGQAQTGTGKTAAFGLPIVQNLEEKNRQSSSLNFNTYQRTCIASGRRSKFL